MFNQFIQILLSVVIWLSSAITTLICSPIYALLAVIVPNFHEYNDMFFAFIQSHILPGLAFGREVFLNVTGFPRPLFQAFITLFLARLSLYTSILIFKFLIKVYYIVRGSR